MRRSTTGNLFRTAVIATLCLGTTATAATLPSMRSGFWQTTTAMNMNMAGQPPGPPDTPTTRYFCQDAATEVAAMKMLTAWSMPSTSVSYQAATLALFAFSAFQASKSVSTGAPLIVSIGRPNERRGSITTRENSSFGSKFLADRPQI